MKITGLKMVRPNMLCGLAFAYLQFGRFNEALSALEEATTIAEQGEDRYCESQATRVRGELLLKRHEADSQEAQVCFKRAVEIAQNQSAKSLELQATISLVRLLRDTNRRDGRAMLLEIYGWFTEGFDTRDLKDAKALLDELSTREA